jgi:hypothetical protein
MPRSIRDALGYFCSSSRWCLTGSVTSAARARSVGGSQTSAFTVWNGLLRPLSRAARRPCADKGTRISGAPFFQILSINSPAFRQGAQTRWSWGLHRRWGRQPRQRRCPWASSTTKSRPCCRYFPTSPSHSFGSYHEPYCYSCPSTGWRPCHSIQSLFRFLVHWRSLRLP